MPARPCGSAAGLSFFHFVSLLDIPALMLLTAQGKARAQAPALL